MTVRPQWLCLACVLIARFPDRLKSFGTAAIVLGCVLQRATIPNHAVRLPAQVKTVWTKSFPQRVTINAIDCEGH